MSRMGKKTIIIPEKVEVKIDDNIFFASGPLGKLNRKFKDDIEIIINDKEINLKPKGNTKQILSLWGTYASHINNMINGVANGFGKKLIIEGVGFRAQVEGKNLVLNLGFSHPIKIEIPEGIKVTVEKNVVSITGFDKEEVGSFCAKVRAFKKPEPYKGKGIRYDDEVIRRKTGKKAATA